MFVIEYKVKAKKTQYIAIDEAIRTTQFIRNKALRYWEDNHGATKYDLNKQCKLLAEEFEWAKRLKQGSLLRKPERR